VLCRNINADEAVAYGATIQAVMLTAPDPKEVLDITPFSLGIGIPEEIMWEVIERYTPIPTKKETPPFFRVKDNQSSMDITVYEDERAMANKFCIALDRKNKVQFEIDEDGILKVSVSAKHKEGWKTISNLVGCFSTAEMERMVEDAKKYKARDEEHKNNIHARNDIQNLLFTISNNMKNLEESAARLLFHSEATREQEKETRGFQNKCSKTRNSTGQVYKHHKAPANDTMKMLQARKDTIKKLPDSIKNLQVIADGTTQWLESKKLTTSDIIGRKMKIEGEYHNISSQIENVQAWNDIQNLLFTISNNMKNLEDSAARLHLQREPTREQEKETHVGYVIGIFWNQKSQDKNRKMIQAHKDTIKKLTDRIKNLQDMADKTTKSLESKNLTTGDIIEQKKRIEGEYNIIGSQIENVQARKDILNLLFTISNNMKNLEDSVARLHLHLEPTQEQEKETSRAVGGLSDDNDTKKMIQAHKDTIKKLTDTIENLHDGISRTIEWLESKKLTTSDIINQMKEIEGVYHYIISQIKNVQARNDIQNLVFTISNNMKNLEDSAASLLPNLGLTQEQEKGTPGYIRSSLPEKAEHKDDRKMIQAHNDIIKKLPDRIKNLQEIADGTAKWLENKKLTTSDITDQKWEIENEYNNILSQIECIYHIITNQTENVSH
jgi:branched-subunit amino acid aminotransferase/4-amino-4-deoxychorismate lyase